MITPGELQLGRDEIADVIADALTDYMVSGKKAAAGTPEHVANYLIRKNVRLFAPVEPGADQLGDDE